MRRKTGYKNRGFGVDEREAQLLICAADRSRSRGLSSVCWNIQESRRRFEVCTCGLESTLTEHRSNCVWGRIPVCLRAGQVPVCLSHHPWRVAVVDLEAGHGFDDGHHGLDGVTVDHRSVLLTLVLWVAVFMDDPENVCKNVCPLANATLTSSTNHCLFLTAVRGEKGFVYCQFK